MIDTPEALEALVARALDAAYVALDTEFVWERTFYPRLGLVQVGLAEDDCHLIDAAAFDGLAPLGRLLAAPGVVKVLHDAEQDLTILRRVTGASPRNIFDTRLAAGFVGLPATLSLGDLLHATVGVRLAKTETRTNWLRRPLSDRQTAYALNDVRYLLAACDTLRARARQRGREAWLQEELTAYDDPERYEENDPRVQFLRIQGAQGLSARKRAVLRELTAWREQEARRVDRPRGHLVSDKTLANVARRLPRSRAALAAVRGVTDREVKQHGPALLAAVERGLALPDEEHPRPPARQNNGEAFGARAHLALAYVVGKSLGEGIDPALVASRSEVKALVADGLVADAARHALLRGWRRAFVGDDVLHLLAGRRAVRLDPDTGLPELA